jgi:hypothetical protein
MKSAYLFIVLLTNLSLYGQYLVFEKMDIESDSLEIRIIEIDSTLSDYKIQSILPDLTLSNEKMRGVISINQEPSKGLVIQCDPKGGYVIIPLNSLQFYDTLIFSDLHLVENNFPPYHIHQKEYWKYPEQRQLKESVKISPKKLNREATEKFKIKINGQDTIIMLSIFNRLNKITHLHGYRYYWWYKLRYERFKYTPKKYVRTYHFIGDGDHIWRSNPVTPNDSDR